MIVGGGGIPDGIRDKFMALAGGTAARLVIIPTASRSADRKEEEEELPQPLEEVFTGETDLAPHPVA